MVRKIIIVLVLIAAVIFCSAVGTLSNYTVQTSLGIDIVTD